MWLELGKKVGMVGMGHVEERRTCSLQARVMSLHL